MNVLLVSPLPPPAGGIAIWTQRYINSKNVKGHNVFIANTAVSGKRINNMEKRRFVSEITRTFDILKNIMSNCKNNSIDIAHLNCPCGTFGLIRDYLSAKIIKKMKIRLITHFRCDVSYQLNNNISKYFFKKLVKLSDKILTLNNVSNRYIMKTCNKETTIIANFLPDKLIKESLKHKNINEDILQIVYVGHVIRTKGCDKIIEVAKNFPDIEFTLVGYISDNIKAGNITDNVKLVGEVDIKEVEKYMSKSDIFLFPTHTEGFSNALAEAMAYGLPVITTAVGANVDMIEDAGGVIVGINDVEGIANAIIKLKNKNLRESMSQWNKNKVRNNYSIDIVMDKLFEIYRR